MRLDLPISIFSGRDLLLAPLLLKWFTADIGYHNIHHLSERIPNYHLEACHRHNLHLLSNVKTLRVGDMLDCAKFMLWDADSNSLVSIESFSQGVSIASELEIPPAAMAMDLK
jgi:acyl-lipid omega-6 desaturase (Delta-12 desaturase)